jgi:hypothetical protein
VTGWNVQSCVICGPHAGYRFAPHQPPMWHGTYERCSEPARPKVCTGQDVANSLNELPLDISEGTIKALEGAAEHPRCGEFACRGETEKETDGNC